MCKDVRRPCDFALLMITSQPQQISAQQWEPCQVKHASDIQQDHAHRRGEEHEWDVDPVQPICQHPADGCASTEFFAAQHDKRDEDESALHEEPSQKARRAVPHVGGDHCLTHGQKLALPGGIGGFCVQIAQADHRECRVIGKAENRAHEYEGHGQCCVGQVVAAECGQDAEGGEDEEAEQGEGGEIQT